MFLTNFFSKLFKKRSNNVIIGFDTELGEMRVMRFFGSDLAGITVDILPCKRKAGEASFFDTLARCFSEYIAEKPLEAGSSVRIVLPDRMIATDQISLPVMKKKLMRAAMQAEYESVYKNHKELLMNYLPVSQNKRFVQFNIILLRRDLLSSLYKSLSLGRAVDGVTFAANATANSALQLRSRIRHSDFFFADVREDKTVLSVLSKGRVIGFASVPYGYKLLGVSRVQYEALIAEHSLGELAVAKAKEKAKNQAALHSDEAEKQSEELELLDDDAIRRGQKKIPKFLQRQAPDSREGIAVENFRIILKWLLLYARQNKYSANLPTPEFILVNLPREYNYIIDALNSPEERTENGFELRAFNTEGEQNPNLYFNLDLFGAAYSGDYNRHNNF